MRLSSRFARGEPTPQVRAAYQRLKSARIPVLGTVVSGVPARTYSYYHSPERSETA